MAEDQRQLPPAGQTLHQCLEKVAMPIKDLSNCILSLTNQPFGAALLNPSASLAQILFPATSLHDRMERVISEFVATDEWPLSLDLLTVFFECCIGCFNPWEKDEEVHKLLVTLAENLECLVAEELGLEQALSIRRHRPPGS